MQEIRPATPDEMPELKRIVALSLHMSTDAFVGLQPEMTLCMFEDDRIASIHGSWPLTMRFNGKALPISGVTTVSTNPIDRNRGHLRKIITQHFHELHEQGERPLAVLYASQAVIYQRFGYAVVSTQHSYEVEPRFIQWVEPITIPGRLREVDPERDFGLLVDLYRQFREDRTGMLHRGRAMWQAGVLEPPPRFDGRQAVVYEEDGDPLGYAVYTIGAYAERPPEPEQKVNVKDVVYLTPIAYRAIWNNFAGMQLARHISWENVPSDDPLPHLILEPRMLRDTAREGILARIVDLPKTMAGRGYDTDARLRYELIDDLLPWNAGKWETRIEGGDAETVPLTSGEPELSMTVNTLAMLIFGQITATEAARAGRIGVHDLAALRRWDDALRTRYAPTCADHF